ncbi:patatin-like phospholipase family protein [Vibrio superstes]|uniref:Serine protease n=1 Tax=Vibrio superstes NBRC 103154 TaxID=1219062 RepID=A0A511QQZ8_9VIBR|nr:patatin-like phospholipase family protein [Vibrio superstes]GEM79012.1 serine protease [Vibrio superstes NBRC 103154]
MPLPFVYRLLILLFLTVLPLTCLSMDSRDIQQRTASPKIALVLAGGGAKGAAHIGVLKALKEMQIPIHLITGTSMGAYVGGLYASGLSVDEIENIIETTDWNRGYIDRAARSDKRVKDKIADDRYQVATDLGLNSSSLTTPSGLIQGQSMLRLLRETSGNVPTQSSFDDLPTQFRAIATDVSTMEAKALGEGNLVDAMMASMSIPALLPPYEIDGHRYIDGGVSNNLPIVVARELGADIIISVDVSSEYESQQEITDVVSMLDQLSVHMVKRSTQQQINALSIRDIYLKPNVGSIGTTEFSAMPDAINKGYQLTIQNQERLSCLSVSTNAYQGFLEQRKYKRTQLQLSSIRQIDSVVFKNRSHYSDEMLLSLLNIRAGHTYTTSQIEMKVSQLYALDYFELVRYHFEMRSNKTQLHVDVKEKSWGPNYLDFRFHVEEDFNANSVYSIGASTHFTGLDSKGSEFRLNVELGTSNRLEAEYYSPITANQTLFYSVYAGALSERGNILQGNLDSSPALEGESDFYPYTQNSLSAEIAVGLQASFWQELRLGLNAQSGKTTLTPVNSMEGFDYERAGVFARYESDTQDSKTFPTRGSRIKLNYLFSNDEYIAPQGRTSDDSSHTQEWTAEFYTAHTYGRHTLSGTAQYSLIDTGSSKLAINPVRLGGFLNFSGIPKDSLVGKEKAYSGLTYRYRWVDNDFGLFHSPVYLGLSAEYGGTWQDTKLDLNEAPLYRSGALYAGVDSPIGPIIVSYSRVETGMDAFYLIIGSSFP